MLAFPKEKEQLVYVFLQSKYYPMARHRRLSELAEKEGFDRIADCCMEHEKKVSAWRGKIAVVLAFAEKMEASGDGKDFRYFTHSMNGKTENAMNKLGIKRMKEILKQFPEYKTPAS